MPKTKKRSPPYKVAETKPNGGREGRRRARTQQQQPTRNRFPPFHTYPSQLPAPSQIRASRRVLYTLRRGISVSSEGLAAKTIPPQILLRPHEQQPPRQDARSLLLPASAWVSGTGTPTPAR